MDLNCIRGKVRAALMDEPIVVFVYCNITIEVRTESATRVKSTLKNDSLMRAL